MWQARFSFLGSVALTNVLLLAWSSSAEAQTRFNERLALPAVNVQDREDVWSMQLNFKDPRMLTVDVPGRGKQIVWYMWYQVINRTGEPRVFIPDFELVTLDTNTKHHDEIMPAVQEKIRELESPYLKSEDFKNSVTITEKAIPPTPRDSAPKAVTGVAIWTDVYKRAKDTTHFSIFVGGLSNGWAIDDQKVIRRKTLQLNFVRRTDGRRLEPDDIQFVEPYKWIYRAVGKDEGGITKKAETPANEN